MKVALLLSVILLNCAIGVYSDDNPTVGELPPEAAQNMVSMLNGDVPSQGTYAAALICLNPKPSEIELLLYTRTNPHSPTVLNPSSPSQIDPTKKIKVVIHGWVAGADAYGIPAIKDAYLQRYDANVIVVNWKKLAWKPYATSCCYLPKIAKMVADFLCVVSQQKNIPMEKIHLVGHSLGAQMSGLIGQFTVEKCSQKIGRITGLDPAGPNFQGLPKTQRLDESDATFVDVLHTNAGFLGYYGNCGHSNFHVNCGSAQPGCPINELSLEQILGAPVAMVCCHHLRALDYMAESINSNKFLGHVCKNCPKLCVPSLVDTSKTVMGEDTPISSDIKNYVVLTNRKPPYAK